MMTYNLRPCHQMSESSRGKRVDVRALRKLCLRWCVHYGLAMDRATKQRDNVRVRQIQTVAYVGDAVVVVERTLLHVPTPMH